MATWGKRSPDLFCRWEDETVGSVAGVGVFSIYIGSGAQCQTLSIQGISEQLWLKVAVTIESGDGNRFGCIASDAGGFVPNQLAMLVPTFAPSKDDVQVFSRKVNLLLHAWLEGKYTELATRLILGCSGSAFNKLQIHQAEVTKNDKKSIQKIV